MGLADEAALNDLDLSIFDLERQNNFRLVILNLQPELSRVPWSDNFRMTFGCLHLNQKTNENISVFLP